MATKFVQSALTKLLAMFARQPIQLCACLALSAFIWFGGDFGAAPTFATLQREAALQVAQATGSHAPAGNTSIVGGDVPYKTGAVVDADARNATLQRETAVSQQSSSASSVAHRIVKLSVAFLTAL